METLGKDLSGKLMKIEPSSQKNEEIFAGLENVDVNVKKEDNDTSMDAPLSQLKNPVAPNLPTYLRFRINSSLVDPFVASPVKKKVEKHAMDAKKPEKGKTAGVSSTTESRPLKPGTTKVKGPCYGIYVRAITSGERERPRKEKQRQREAQKKKALKEQQERERARKEELAAAAVSSSKSSSNSKKSVQLKEKKQQR